MTVMPPELRKFTDKLLTKVGMPYFFNMNMIIRLAGDLKATGFAKRPVGKDKVKVLRLHVDKQYDFITMFSYINDDGEQRFVMFKGDEHLALDLPKQITDRLEFVDRETFNPDDYDEVVSGRLGVPGAIGDTMRGIDFDMENLEFITAHGLSIDTHAVGPSVHDRDRYVARYDHTFPPASPQDKPYTVHRGEFPRGITPIFEKDVWHPQTNSNGLWWPTRKTDWTVKYIGDVERESRVNVSWWRHCTKFTFGQLIDQAVWAGIMLHALVRNIEPLIFMKGLGDPEFFGIFAPVRVEEDDQYAQVNVAGLQLYLDYDLIIIDGQAASHCVLDTVKQLFAYIYANAPDQISKLVVIRDGSSFIPLFEDAAEREYQRMEAHGLRRMTYKQASALLRKLNNA